MAQKEKGREVLSAGAGLAAEVALESGGQLGEITGVGAKKLEAYGDAILRVLRDAE